MEVDLTEDATFGSAAAAFGLQSAAVFPILHGDDVFGVVEVMGRAPPTDPKLKELLVAIGSQIGLFVARSRAIAAIQRSEARLSAIIENLSEGIFIANSDGEVIEWNRAAFSLLGMSKASDEGRAFADVLRQFTVETLEGADVRLEDRPLAKTLRGESVRDYELCVRRIGSDWQRVFSYTGSLVEQEDGTTIAVVAIDDVTDRLRREELRRLSEQLAADNLRIREASRLKSEFLANMSHELRTPLNAIIGFTSLVHTGRAGPLGADQREYLGDVLASSRHLLQLINDVLDLAKVESGRMEVSVKSVQTAKVIDEVTDVLRELAAEKHLELSVRIEPALSEVTLDERIVKQILYNYLSNAIKFTASGGRLSIRVAGEGESFFRFEVEDSGIGIGPTDIPRLFVEFQQLDSGTNKKFQGTGLGLAISKKLAEAHGGRVGVESTVGVGSRFFVVLPRLIPG